MSAIEDFARRQGFGVLRVGSYADPRPSADAIPDPPRVRIQPRLEFRVALGPDLPATLARMGAGHRRNIRKARELDFEFSENTSLEGALALHALQEQTFHRRRDLGNENAAAWPVESYRRTMAAYLEARVIRFFFASRRGAPLSGIGTLEFGGSAYYLVGGTSAEGYTCKAVFALFAYTIERLIGQGCSELNLGGVGVDVQDERHVDHGLYRFKAGFGSPVHIFGADGGSFFGNFIGKPGPILSSESLLHQGTIPLLGDVGKLCIHLAAEHFMAGLGGIDRDHVVAAFQQILEREVARPTLFLGRADHGDRLHGV